MMELQRIFIHVLFLVLIFNVPFNLFGQDEKNIINIDSTFVMLSKSSEQIEIKSNLAQSERIYYELLVSPLAGGLIAIPIGFISLGIAEAVGYSDRYPWGYAAIGSLIGHAIGSAYSVYLFERNGGNDVVFSETLLASLLGSAMSVGVLELTGGDLWENNIGIIAIISLPTIASIIYSNIIAPKKNSENLPVGTPSDNPIIIKSLSHKDYYNSKKIVDLELMRIDF